MMKKIAVLSTNNNPDYFYYAPIVEWIWNKFGWEVALFKTSDVGDVGMRSSTTKEYVIPNIEGVETHTLAQVVRHFAADVLPKDAYIMVQDIDLLPLQDFWQPDLDKMTIYGWETTGYSFIPVHYTGMMGDKWYSVMDCTGDLKSDMEREMKANGRAYETVWEKRWDADWDILTTKVLAKKNDFTFIERGWVQLGKNQTPKGRVDRCSIVVDPTNNAYSWGYTTNQSNLLDMHCENHNPSSPEKWKMIKDELIKHHLDLPEWIDEHTIKHHALYGR